MLSPYLCRDEDGHICKVSDFFLSPCIERPTLCAACADSRVDADYEVCTACRQSEAADWVYAEDWLRVRELVRVADEIAGKGVAA